MNNLEVKKLRNDVENDMFVILANEKYLLDKFRKLSIHGKEEVVSMLNLALFHDEQNKNNSSVVIPIDFNRKCIQRH